MFEIVNHNKNNKKGKSYKINSVLRLNSNYIYE